LFEEENSSFSSFVLAERLPRVRRMLVERRCAHLSIAQIAHENGFGDVSYSIGRFVAFLMPRPPTSARLQDGNGSRNGSSRDRRLL
jgi:AraC-like DNA-binding protein